MLEILGGQAGFFKVRILAVSYLHFSTVSVIQINRILSLSYASSAHTTCIVLPPDKPNFILGKLRDVYHFSWWGMTIGDDKSHYIQDRTPQGAR